MRDVDRADPATGEMASRENEARHFSEAIKSASAANLLGHPVYGE